MVDSIRYAVTDWEMYLAQMTVPWLVLGTC